MLSLLSVDSPGQHDAGREPDDGYCQHHPELPDWYHRRNWSPGGDDLSSRYFQITWAPAKTVLEVPHVLHLLP